MKKLTKKQVKQICNNLKVDFISFDFLGRGSHNKNYVINTGQDRFVLRIEDNLQFDNLKEEYKFLKKTKGNLGPRVFLFDNSHKIIDRNFIIEEFIEGSHPKKADDKFIKIMANWYKQLHKIKVKKKLVPLSKRVGVKRYKKFRRVLDNEIKNKLDKLYFESIALLDKNQKLFSHVKYLSLNHGDPTRTNIFYDGKKVRLIDWEFVHYNIPEADLVFFVWSYNLNKGQKKLFLNTYGFSKSKSAEKRFNLRLLAHIWAMISWRLERLDLVYKKKLARTGYCSSKEEIYKENEEDLVKLKKLLVVNGLKS